MQSEQNGNRHPTPSASPLPVWSAPQLVVVDAAMTQATFTNVGPDSGIFS